jgi:hypothetical protein
VCGACSIAKMTAAEKKALNAEKQKQLQECLKAGG